jgi:SAM-dependent methyltransferase
MYDFIRKLEFFDWWDAGWVDKGARNLKSIQDAWIMSELHDSVGLRIGEIGGGDSRMLRHLRTLNSCVNIDKFEGFGKGPQSVPQIEDVEVVQAYMGDFNKSLEDASFDALFSISVIEHVHIDNINDCFADMARLLKPGGRLLHAIDIYLVDDPKVMPRIDAYRDAVCNPELGLSWKLEPVIGEKSQFRCDYASNSDQQLAYSCGLVSGLRKSRATMQACCIKMELIKD